VVELWLKPSLPVLVELDCTVLELRWSSVRLPPNATPSADHSVLIR
jgi:hypothetical protein